MKIITVLCAIMLLSGSLASAHGLATTKTELVDNYLVQLEYDNLGNINSGEVTSFSFELLDPKTKESANFDRVYVIIRKSDGPLVFFGNLLPTDEFVVKSSRASIYIPDEGEHKIQLYYYKGEEQLVEHTFTLPVDSGYSFAEDPKSVAKKYIWIYSLIGGIILGIAITNLLKKSSKDKSESN